MLPQIIPVPFIFFFVCLFFSLFFFFSFLNQSLVSFSAKVTDVIHFTSTSLSW